MLAIQSPAVRAEFETLYAGVHPHYRADVRVYLRNQTRHCVVPYGLCIRDICTDRELQSAIRYLRRKQTKHPPRPRFI